MTIETLFEQTSELEIKGARLSGEAEILHEIEDYFRQVQFYPIIRDQIKTILESVPSIFSETWKSPEAFTELNPQEVKAYESIAKSGLYGCPGSIIQKVIELAIEYRERYSKKEN